MLVNLFFRYMQEFAVSFVFLKKPSNHILTISFFENCGDRCFDLFASRKELQLRTGTADGMCFSSTCYWSASEIIRSFVGCRYLGTAHVTKKLYFQSLWI